MSELILHIKMMILLNLPLHVASEWHLAREATCQIVPLDLIDTLDWLISHVRLNATANTQKVALTDSEQEW